MTNKGNENTNTGSIASVAVDGVCDQHSGHDLVASRADTHANQRGNVPRVSGVVQLHQKDNQARDAQSVPEVTQPQTVLGLWVAAIKLAAPHVHPQVRHASTNLLADNCADNDSNHLQAVLLGVEAEQLGEELRDLDRHHDARPQEFHGVGTRGDHDARVRSVGERLDKVVEGEWGLVDATKRHVLLLEGRRLGLLGLLGGGDLDFGGLAGADVAGLGSEKEVEDELEAVDLD